jgi:hypothetical protein
MSVPWNPCPHCTVACSNGSPTDNVPIAAQYLVLAAAHLGRLFHAVGDVARRA